MASNKYKISDYLIKERETMRGLNLDRLVEVFNILDDCLKNERNVYVFGNGGSGSTASHMTNDFNNATFINTDKTFNFRCLNDNIPTVLALANDIGYDDVFLYQLVGHLNENDVVIAISGSGNSENIINAVMYAKECNALVIGFTGYDGGRLKKLADYSVDTSIDNMEITEDIHLIIEHLLISLFYDNYGKDKHKRLALIKERKD